MLRKRLDQRIQQFRRLLDEISLAVNAYTVERLPALLAGAEALEVNRASTEASIRDFAGVLAAGADPAEAAGLASPTRAYAQDGAQHGIPLTPLMRSYRLAHAATSRHLNAILELRVALALAKLVAEPPDVPAAADKDRGNGIIAAVSPLASAP